VQAGAGIVADSDPAARGTRSAAAKAAAPAGGGRPGLANCPGRGKQLLSQTPVLGLEETYACISRGLSSALETARSIRRGRDRSTHATWLQAK